MVAATPHLHLDSPGEEELQQLRDMLQQVEQYCAWQARVLHQLPVPVMLLNRHGAIVEANDRALQLLGEASGEIKSSPLISRLFPSPEVGGRLRLALTQAIADGEAQLDESPMVTFDQRPLWAELRLTRLRTRPADARGIELACVVVDLTDRQVARRAEQQLAEAQHLQALSEEASRTKSALLSRVSHELRTPLNAIQGFAQLLQVDSPTLAQRREDYVQHIVTASKQLLELVEEMLDLNHAQTGHLDLSMVATPLADLVQPILAQNEPMAAPLNLSLIAEDTTGIPDVRADARRVRHVLTNLVSNAIKFNRQGGEVRVRLGADAKEGWVEVQDTGLGMSPTQMQHLFEPFNRLGAERSKTRGYGLGLSICKAYMNAMGGRLEVRSVQGEGSCFRMVLPLWHQARG